MLAGLAFHAWILVTLLGVEVHAEDIPFLVQKAKPDLVQTATRDPQNKSIKRGTDFSTSSDGLLLTNYPPLLASSPSASASPSPAGPRTLVVPDEYPFIQLAMDVARAGDTVLVKAGVYYEALEFRSGIELRGENPDTTVVRLSSPAKAAKLEEVQCPLMVRNCESGKVTNLAFEQEAEDGHYPGWPPDAITLLNSSITVETCHATSATASGIGIYYPGSRPVLRNNQCRNCKYNGISFGNAAGGEAIGNVCEANTHGIGVAESGTNPELVSNHCRNNKLRGISFGFGASGKAINNVCELNVWGIWVSGSGTSVELVNNQCRNNNADGILISDGANGNVISNICDRNETGIRVEGAIVIVEDNPFARRLAYEANATLENNFCSNNTYYGIKFSNAALGKAVQNTCKRNGSGMRIDNSSPMVSGNRLLENYGWGLIYGNGAKPGLEVNEFKGNTKGEINPNGS